MMDVTVNYTVYYSVPYCNYSIHYSKLQYTTVNYSTLQ